jgi:hypothetical protein
MMNSKGILVESRRAKDRLLVKAGVNDISELPKKLEESTKSTLSAAIGWHSSRQLRGQTVVRTDSTTERGRRVSMAAAASLAQDTRSGMTLFVTTLCITWPDHGITDGIGSIIDPSIETISESMLGKSLMDGVFPFNSFTFFTKILDVLPLDH